MAMGMDNLQRARHTPAMPEVRVQVRRQLDIPTVDGEQFSSRDFLSHRLLLCLLLRLPRVSMRVYAADDRPVRETAPTL
jgi:hypothetical protein